MAAEKARATVDISIHALREEGDAPILQGFLCGGNFYPRPPRGGRPGETATLAPAKRISIHALREEGDSVSKRGYRVTRSISIHALREEGDLLVAMIVYHPTQFLSTPSARRATWISRLVK